MRKLFIHTKIPQHVVQDRVIWHEAPYGVYRVKLGYRYWQNSVGNNYNVTQSNGCKRLWALNIPHKIKVFLWRFCRNNIPVRNRLAGKNVRVAIGCPFCNNDVEHLLHVFFDCQFATGCWQHIGLHYDMWSVEDAPTWLLERLSTEPSDKLIQIAAVLWGIWHFRNMKVWENKSVPAEFAVERSVYIITEWQAARERNNKNRNIAVGESHTNIVRWKPPGVDELKINVDASVRQGTGSYSIGMVIRDHTGKFVQGKCMRFEGDPSVFEAETIGVEEALSWIYSLDLHRVIVESGGISNGEIITMKIAFKPTSTIRRKQNMVTRDKHETELIARGRHDPCVVPRVVPMVESMVALVLVDQLMAQYAQNQLFPINSDLQESVLKPQSAKLL